MDEAINPLPACVDFKSAFSEAASMNVPSIYRKATAGFIIPPRKMSQMLVSAAQGAFSLFSEPNRVEFINLLENGTIQEGVLSQATFGPAVMLSLFHDLQNPLFKRTKFSVSEFLSGVGPALENFHNVGGALENQLQKMIKEASDSKKETETAEDSDDKTHSNETTSENANVIITPTGLHGNEKEALLSAMQLFGISDQGKKAMAILENEWSEEAEKDPDSLAGQLSRMVSKELFHMHEMNAKTAFLMQEHMQTITFQEGSCKVINVALLSARAAAFRKTDPSPESFDSEGDKTSRPQFEPVDNYYDSDEGETSIAAQLEVLYDVTQTFEIEKSAIAAIKSEEGGKKDGSDDAAQTTKASSANSSSSAEIESRQTTIVGVATLEGWLKGGPDDELRWRLSLHRPAFEFPGIEHSY
ncbi:hypothetical protein IV203_036379 [Nitzschia inconspicua]|uniref:Uncharacterized protein n=1 Tax=Nitzschia inconspicua TaxID=303405 RepID=A0A9K3LF27_9STRA|nr:hypothetical protein IV203_036379 [Nitzschia inconspicua]